MTAACRPGPKEDQSIIFDITPYRFILVDVLWLSRETLECEIALWAGDEVGIRVDRLLQQRCVILVCIGTKKLLHLTRGVLCAALLACCLRWSDFVAVYTELSTKELSVHARFRRSAFRQVRQ